MFCLNENNIYHLYSQGIDMRKGVEGLCGIIRTYQYSPTNQEVYVFANKSRTLVKMLHWERGGFVVYYKRLEQGRLSPSIFHHKNATVFIDIRWDEWCCSWKASDLEQKGGNDIILSKKNFDNQRYFRNFTS